jgi:hypothetical protein
VNERLREHLNAQLGKKVDAHGLVVWSDPEREYGREIAATVVPSDTKFVAYDGSWFELRHKVEGLLAGETPPRVVLYVDTPPPLSDPLLEVREAGITFTIRLGTLVQQALAGQLTGGRLREIGQKARTLVEAEAALTGDGSGDPRLVAALGTTDVRRMVIAVVSGQREAAIAEADAWGDVAGLLARTVGLASTAQGEELRRSALRHMLLAEMAARVGDLPSEVAPTWEQPTKDQCRSAAEILNVWRKDREALGSYVHLCLEADRQLDLVSALPWTDALADLDSMPSIESIALREGLDRIAANEFARAGTLARQRLSGSLWAGNAVAEVAGVPDWGPRWEVLAAVADLRQALVSAKIPAGGSSDLLSWYAASGWTVDRAHRQLETRSSMLGLEGNLEGEIAHARGAYEEWLGRLLKRYVTAVAADGLDSGSIGLQSHIYKSFVAGSKQATAYIWVDALRFELGMELADRLRARASQVDLKAAVAALPSITPVGMANLCPGAEAGLEISLQKGKLSVLVNGTEVKDASARVELVRQAQGRIEDIQLSKLLAQGEKKLAESLGGVSLVIVRSQEIDAAGESGMLATSWQGFEDTVLQIDRAAARLAQIGFRRLVITADHGFVALSRPLGQDRRVDAPTGGKGELHARAWVGEGAIDSPATVRIPLASTGIKSDLDLLCPANLAVFRGSWSGQFFHGGVSPQELLIPVIVAELPAPAEPETTKVDIEVSGGKLTSGVFAATIAVPGQRKLFEESLIRLLVRKKGSAPAIARIFRGEGHDPETDLVRLRGGTATLTFRLIQNLSRDDEIEIVALDATTDRKLGSATVQAAVPIVVEEDLS